MLFSSQKRIILHMLFTLGLLILPAWNTDTIYGGAKAILEQATSTCGCLLLDFHVTVENKPLTVLND